MRDREGDIVLLATSFVRKYAEENKKKILGFTKKALTALVNHKFPGNVRELENRIRRAVIMAQSSTIANEDLELEGPDESERTTLKEAREKTDREVILRVLKENNFNLSQSAADLGISRPTLYELMEKLGIKK